MHFGLLLTLIHFYFNNLNLMFLNLQFTINTFKIKVKKYPIDMFPFKI